jgi:hypothetical protein
LFEEGLVGKDNTERRRMTDAADTADRVLRSGRVQPSLFLVMDRRIFHNSFIPPMAGTDRVTVGRIFQTNKMKTAVPPIAVL